MLLASERCASATFTCGTHRAKPLAADKNCIFCKRENGIALPADRTKASFGNKNWSKKGAGGVKVQCPAGSYGSALGLQTNACSGLCGAGFFCK